MAAQHKQSKRDPTMTFGIQNLMLSLCGKPALLLLTSGTGATRAHSAMYNRDLSSSGSMPRYLQGQLDVCEHMILCVFGLCSVQQGLVLLWVHAKVSARADRCVCVYMCAYAFVFLWHKRAL